MHREIPQIGLSNLSPAQQKERLTSLLPHNNQLLKLLHTILSRKLSHNNLTCTQQPPQHAAPQQPAIKTTPYHLVQEAVPQQPHLHTTPRQPPQQAIPQQPVEHTTAQQPGQHAVPQRPVQADKIQLLIKNFSDSKNYAIRVSPTTLIQDFMNLIADTIKGYIPNSQQMLTYAGKVLESGKTIADYVIQSNQTIYLTGRLRGG
ncbi:gamma-gliadin [Biomphalaria pfeifferi]|uniref:Gamma-gliadin n=1 Tax=Biomphalaria pfeifferi TaxID=112525 RepID=A0AAD8FMD7_BIOPF|nr:gamma-gliadin [Biomphalaria pfeifferi]